MSDGLAYPPITPYLIYADADAAVEFLGRAFGFRERLRWLGPDGRLAHAEMTLGDGMIMLGSPDADFIGPGESGATVHIHVYVDDVDAHHRRAAAEGAQIVEPPNEQPYGDRRYDAADPEGHRWTFATRVRDVPPEEWGGIVP